MRDRISFRCAGSIAGQALAGLGAFFLCGEVSGTILGVVDLLGGKGAQGLAMLPAVSLAILHISRAAIVKPTLVSSWPFLLVMLGIILAWDGSKESNLNFTKKDDAPVDRTSARSTLK